ncbi:MAG: oligosaccharide flippase family protein [Patescibacteria group bacterium]|jgi:O-antigen/teichoic acid export membrane protein
MKEILINISEKLHRRIFGHEMSPTMRQFLGNLSWSIGGYIIGGLIIFVVNILAGRILGPAEYGKYNLITAIGSFFSVFMIFGFDATATKYISASNTEEEKKFAISNSLRFSSITGLVILALVLVFSANIAGYLNTTRIIVFLGALVGFCTMYSTLFNNFIKSLQLFKFQSIVFILQNLIIFSFFILFFLVFKWGIGDNSHQYFASIVILAMLTIITIYLIKVRNNIGAWSQSMWKKMIPYWRLTLAGSFIAITLSQIDKFFLSRYLGPAELGLYSAYLLSSVLIINQLITALNNVFFPMVNKSGNLKAVLKKTNQLFLIGFVPLFIATFIISIIILKLLGTKYELNFIYVALVSLVSCMQVLMGFYGSIINSSQKLFSFFTKVYYFKPIAIILLIVFLVYNPNLISIYTTFLLVLVASLYDIINARICFRTLKG